MITSVAVDCRVLMGFSTAMDQTRSSCTSENMTTAFPVASDCRPLKTSAAEYLSSPMIVLASIFASRLIPGGHTKTLDTQRSYVESFLPTSVVLQ